MVLGDEVLIGQTVLEKLDLLVDCRNQRVVPNPAHPDQPVTKVKYLRPQTQHHPPHYCPGGTQPSTAAFG